MSAPIAGAMNAPRANPDSKNFFILKFLELVSRADATFADREVAAEAGPELNAGETVVEVFRPDRPVVVPRHPLQATAGHPPVLGLVGWQRVDALDAHIAPGGTTGSVNQHGWCRRPAEARAYV